MKISCDLDNRYNANTERAIVVNNVEPNGLAAVNDGSFQQNTENLSTRVPNNCSWSSNTFC